MFNPLWHIEGFLIRLRRLWLWLPVIWHHEDWDYAFNLRLFKFSLLQTRKCMEHCNHGAHTEDRVAELAQVDVLLRNVVDEDPDDEWSLHYDQWHIGKDFNDPCKLGKQVCYKATKDSMARNQRNWRKLWRHIEKHMQGWWD